VTGYLEHQVMHKKKEVIQGNFKLLYQHLFEGGFEKHKFFRKAVTGNCNVPKTNQKCTFFVSHISMCV
jgi:hypothetical protein